MPFSFDIPTIRLYKYYFLGVAKPIIIEATDQLTARTKLNNVLHTLPDAYKNSRIVGQTVTVPAFGVSELQTNSDTLVWVGKKHSKSGWMPKKEFQNKFGTYDKLS